MKPKHIKQLLISSIKQVSAKKQKYALQPNVNFTRRRKLPLESMLTEIIKLESKSLSNEIIDMFNTADINITASAFVQQRQKIKPEAFSDIFAAFNQRISAHFPETIRILAVDGSDIHVPTDEHDKDSFIKKTNGQKPYNLLHLNALYDLNNKIYVDTVLQKCFKQDECSALCKMVDASTIKKALVIADRGYESFNNLAHIQEKNWFFLFRIRDGYQGMKSGLVLPETDEFDISFELNITRKQTNDVKTLLKNKNSYRFIPSNCRFDYLPQKSRKADSTLFYKLKFRLVRFKISENLYETIITNLNKNDYSPSKLKELYAFRWGIETSFRDLKYTLGMLNFHTKKMMCIYQEIYAHLIMYNFVATITSHVAVVIKQRKHKYKVNFSVAVHICRAFLKGNASSSEVETVIAKYLIPLRLGRLYPRDIMPRRHTDFSYRVS